VARAPRRAVPDGLPPRSCLVLSANEIIASWEEGELAFAEASRQYQIYQD